MIKSNQYFSYIRVRRMNKKQQKVRKGIYIVFDIFYIISCLLITIGIITLLKQDVARMTHVQQVQAKAEEALSQKVVTIEKPVETTEKDNRVDTLTQFLESKNSPLAPYAKLIVDEADKNDIGWTKIVAISGMESQYCKQTIPNSFNCWGIGGSNLIHYSSYEEGIIKASQLIGRDYKVNENQGIKYKYCPESDGCNPSWASIVTNYSKEILAMVEK